MRLFGGLIIGLPHFDGLVGLTREETETGAIEGRRHDTGLRIQRPRLCHRIHGLEAVARLPVPEAHGAVVATGEHDVVFVDGDGVDDGVVALEVLHEGALGTLPLLDAAGASASKGELPRVNGDVADALLVVREHTHRLAGGQIPQADRSIQRSRDDLRIGLLALDVGHGALVARQDMNVAARAHVPHAGDAVPTAGDQKVKVRV